MEKFLSLFYFLLQFKLIEKLATIYYGLGNTLLIKLLKKKNLVSLYIKSDIKGLYFEIGVSDFDYVIVPSCQSELHYISRVYAVLNRFFPFIKDYDVYTEKQLQHLVRFGGIKFNRADSWVLLFGNEQRTSAYFYHPYKLFCDQMDEIYF